eukprot:scaffold15382_cov115-Amphora_coffeaeformis.AAC.1
MVVENGNTRFKVQHNDVGLSQESYEAPEYEETDGVYEFEVRHTPPTDPSMYNDDNDDEIQSQNGNPVDAGVEYDADAIMCQESSALQDILEGDE